MAEFLPAFEQMIRNEGGYTLHQVAGDRGGQTYAGIARKMHPRWAGWSAIDQGEIPASQLVRDFYLANFWRPVLADSINDQAVARNVFDFAVNAGVPVAVRLAQIVAGATPDGKAGPKTIQAINAMDQALFVSSYALAKIARYRDIVTRDHSQAKFLLGWINRTLREAA